MGVGEAVAVAIGAVVVVDTVEVGRVRNLHQPLKTSSSFPRLVGSEIKQNVLMLNFILLPALCFLNFVSVYLLVVK